MFALETIWMPSLYRGEEGGDKCDDEDSGDEGDRAEGAEHCSGLDDDYNDSSDEELSDFLKGDELTLRQEAVARKRRHRKDTEEVEHGAIGSFGFFIGDGAPLLVGKVKEVRVGMEEEEEDEVLLHWYTPCKALVDDASSIDFDMYANATFNAAYKVVQDAGRSGSRATRKYVEDTSWEPSSGIVATSPTLVGSGKKIPATVKQILKSAKQSQEQAAGKYEQDRADASRPKVSAGKTLRGSLLPTEINADYGQEETPEENTKETEEGRGGGGGGGYPRENSEGEVGEGARGGGRAVTGEEGGREAGIFGSRTSSRSRQPKRHWAEPG